MGLYNKQLVKNHILDGSIKNIKHIENRQIGQSTAIALETIAKAINNPNIPIPIYDHYNDKHMTRLRLFDVIIDMCKKLNLNNMYFNKSNITITYTGVIELSDIEINILETVYSSVNLPIIEKLFDKIYN